MLFAVKWLLPVNGQQQKVNFIFEDEEETLLKTKLKNIGLVVLDITNLESLPGEFDTYFVFETKDWELKGYTDKKLKEAFKYLFEELHLKGIAQINSLSAPVDQEKIQKLLDYFNSRVLSGDSGWEAVKTDDKRLLQLREVASKTVDEALELLERLKGKVPSTYLTQIKTKSDELIKLKLSANVERILDLIEDLLKLMEEAELYYYSELEKQEEDQWKKGVISDLEILIELEKAKKAKALKDVGVKNLSSDMKLYGILGTKGVYVKLLVREFLKRLQSLDSIVLYLIDFVILFSFFYIMLAMAKAFYLYLTSTKDFFRNDIYYILVLGVIGFSFSLFKTFTKKGEFLRNLMVFVVSFLVSGILIFLIKANFAL